MQHKKNPKKFKKDQVTKDANFSDNCVKAPIATPRSTDSSLLLVVIVIVVLEVRGKRRDQPGPLKFPVKL